MSTPGPDDCGTVTILLREMRAGSRPAFDELFRLLQQDLRRFAQSLLRKGPHHDFTGTELVNMACARLLGKGQPQADDRAHLFFLIGRAMRDTLVEEARKEAAQARGGGRARVPMIDFTVDERTSRLDVLDLHEALTELERRDPAGARVIELRFFAGLSLEQTAEAIGCSLAAVRRDWTYARAWLSERLSRMGAARAGETPGPAAQGTQDLIADSRSGALD
jgi:RNA polymerase sigma factor (TIGR02999 family)